MHPSADSLDTPAVDDDAILERMQALASSGRRAEALALYARARDRIWESQSREPSEGLRTLQASLLAEAINAVPRQRDPDGRGAPSTRGLRPLPAQSSTTYVGRDALTATVDGTVREAKVVTLHGPGGVGKTRLALAVAHGLAADPEVSVAWIDLAPARDPESALYAAADAIGIRDIDLDDPVGSLLRALGDDPTVVVVDNCEHLLDVAARLVDGLQARGQDLHVLATSREPLDVDGEHVVFVPPLTVGDDGAASPALQLFDDRLSTARGHRLEPDEMADALAITARLDGLPLAVELAAGRGAALGLDQLRDRISLDLLDRGRRTSSARHRSLRGVLDWSHALLEEDEQLLFARLSVFAGTFSLARAEVVCADDRVPAARLPNLLSDLTGRSLVSPVRHGADSRHRLLQPLREYAAEQLAASGEAPRWRVAHARHMADVAAARATAMNGPGEASATEQLVDDLDELRVAMEYALTAEDVHTGLRLANALHELGCRQMRLELLGWADAVTQLPGAERDPLFPQVLGTAARGRWLRGDIDGALERGRLALSVLRGPGDTRGVRALLAMAEANLISGRLPDAADIYREAIAVDAGPGPTIDAEGGLAMTLADLGQGDDGRDAARRALQHASDSAAPSHLAWAFYALGRTLATSDPVEAVSMLEQSAELARSVDNNSNEYSAQTRILVVQEGLVPPERLLADYRTTLERWRRTGSTTFLAVTLRNLAGPLERLGMAEEAGLLRTAATISLSDPDRHERLEDSYALAMSVLDRAGAAPVIPRQRRTSPADDGPVRAEFVQDGALWRVGLAGATAHVPDSKGMHDLAHLLSRPGVEVHCLDLVAATAPAVASGAESTGGSMVRESDLGDVIDAKARGAYEQRVRELRDLLDDEPDHPDSERRQQEYDFVVAELAAAYGLGKKPRRAGDPVEKARTTVTWRIKHAIRRIAEVDAPLGRHLKQAVRTGRYCAYTPDEQVDWAL